MPTEILMPALSPTMEKGKLAKWLVKEGDDVTSGDIIAEIETDKATMEVEAVDEGKVGKILVEEGTDDVAVNTAIAVLFIAEQSLTTYGLGYFIVVETYQVLRYPQMYTGILAMSLLGLILYFLIKALEHRFCRYQEQNGA